MLLRGMLLCSYAFTLPCSEGTHSPSPVLVLHCASSGVVFGASRAFKCRKFRHIPLRCVIPPSPPQAHLTRVGFFRTSRRGAPCCPHPPCPPLPRGAGGIRKAWGCALEGRGMPRPDRNRYLARMRRNQPAVGCSGKKPAPASLAPVGGEAIQQAIIRIWYDLLSGNEKRIVRFGLLDPSHPLCYNRWQFMGVVFVLWANRYHSVTIYASHASDDAYIPYMAIRHQL
jgi:hypothetical protein